jgi:hypothetical protein
MPCWPASRWDGIVGSRDSEEGFEARGERAEGAWGMTYCAGQPSASVAAAGWQGERLCAVGLVAREAVASSAHTPVSWRRRLPRGRSNGGGAARARAMTAATRAVPPPRPLPRRRPHRWRSCGEPAAVRPAPVHTLVLTQLAGAVPAGSPVIPYIVPTWQDAAAAAGAAAVVRASARFASPVARPRSAGWTLARSGCATWSCGRARRSGRRSSVCQRTWWRSRSPSRWGGLSSDVETLS